MLQLFLKTEDNEIDIHPSGNLPLDEGLKET